MIPTIWSSRQGDKTQQNRVGEGVRGGGDWKEHQRTFWGMDDVLNLDKGLGYTGVAFVKTQCMCT